MAVFGVTKLEIFGVPTFLLLAKLIIKNSIFNFVYLLLCPYLEFNLSSGDSNFDFGFYCPGFAAWKGGMFKVLVNF